jgi:hypothetical protein
LELAAVLGGKALDFREEAGWAARADQHASQLRTLSGEQAVVSGVNGGGARGTTDKGGSSPAYGQMTWSG